MVIHQLNLFIWNSIDYRQWVQKGQSSPTEQHQSISDKVPLTPPPPLSERMRKRRAFADRDLDAVMFQREQQAAELQRLTGCGDTTPPPGLQSPYWNALHPIRFQVLPFQHHPLFQQKAIPLVVKTESKQTDDSEDSDVEVDVTTSSPPTPPTSVPVKSKISFSVESIIGRP